MRALYVFCLVGLLTGCLHRVDNDCQYWGRHSVSGRFVKATYDSRTGTASGEFVMPEAGEGPWQCAATISCLSYQMPESMQQMGANAVFEGTGPLNMCTQEFTYNQCHIEFYQPYCPTQPTN